MAAGFRERVELGFESWGRTVAARPVTVLVASLVFAAACISGLPHLRVDVSFEAFLQADDPVRVAYESFREQFGRDERVTIAAAPGGAMGGGDVFDLAFLEKLRAFHEAIEERIPYVDEITSLGNSGYTEIPRLRWGCDAGGTWNCSHWLPAWGARLTPPLIAR